MEFLEKGKGRSTIHRIILILTMLIVSMCIGIVLGGLKSGEAYAAGVNLSDPIIKPVDYLQSGQRVTYDCIYFGSYPQAEIITKEQSKNYAVKKELVNDYDVIIDDKLYNRLSSKKCVWDRNGDTMLNGVKYRRLKVADFSDDLDSPEAYVYDYINDGIGGKVNHMYNWIDVTTYHYFKYEPIKWRVLSVSDTYAVLLSNLILDGQEYDKVKNYRNVSYGACTLRTWLNSDFAYSAFSDSEKKEILDTTIPYPIKYSSSDKEYVNDKVFLLSDNNPRAVWYFDEYSVLNPNYGFADSSKVNDEARQANASMYAKANALSFKYKGENAGKCEWFIRSESMIKRSYFTNSSSIWQECDSQGVSYSGNTIYGENDSFMKSGIRAAIRVKLSNTTYKYAGTVSTDDLSKGQEFKEITTGASYRVTQSKGNSAIVDYIKPQNKKLNNVTIQNSIILKGQTCIVRGIATSAFKNFKNLKCVIIDDSVDKIGDNAFSGCKNLKTITFKSTKMNKNSFGKNAFKGINKKATFKCPKKQLKNYKKWIKKAGAPKTAKYKKQ